MDCKEIERTLIKTYRKEIWSPFMKALSQYELIQENDVIAVCISGGKDSMILAKCMQILSRFSKTHFEVKFLVMNPGYNQVNLDKIVSNAQHLEIPITIMDNEIFDVVNGMEKNACYLCARMRRGYLYYYAQQLGCNKIALGHHFDDVIETTLLNMFYAGEVSTMLPKLHSDNFPGMQLIRPLYKVKEKDIIRWMQHCELSFLQCACRFTEMIEQESNSKAKTSKRDEIKQWIKQYKEVNPNADDNVFRAMSNVNVEKVIATRKGKEVKSFLSAYEKETKDDVSENETVDA